jgi:hypothetical protein
MAHAATNRSKIHNKDVVTLIKRLLIDPSIVGQEKSDAVATAINTFWGEFHWFQSKRRIFAMSTCGRLRQERPPQHFDGTRETHSGQQLF